MALWTGDECDFVYVKFRDPSKTPLLARAGYNTSFPLEKSDFLFRKPSKLREPPNFFFRELHVCSWFGSKEAISNEAVSASSSARVHITSIYFHTFGTEGRWRRLKVLFPSTPLPESFTGQLAFLSTFRSDKPPRNSRRDMVEPRMGLLNPKRF